MFFTCASMPIYTHQTETDERSAPAVLSQSGLDAGRYVLTRNSDTQAGSGSVLNMVFISSRGHWTFGCTILFFACWAKTYIHTHTSKPTLVSSGCSSDQSRWLERSFNPQHLFSSLTLPEIPASLWKTHTFSP